MNWFPKKTKYTKVRKGRIQSFYKKNSYQNHFGMYAIQAMEPGKITGQQLEAVRRTLTNKNRN